MVPSLASVPPFCTLTLLSMAPNPSTVAFAIVRAVPAPRLPVMVKVPAFTRVGPVCVLVPLNVSVPGPLLISASFPSVPTPSPSRKMPPKDCDPATLTVSAPLPAVPDSFSTMPKPKLLRPPTVSVLLANAKCPQPSCYR
jgi:hypothetical protein